MTDTNTKQTKMYNLIAQIITIDCENNEKDITIERLAKYNEELENKIKEQSKLLYKLFAYNVLDFEEDEECKKIKDDFLSKMRTYPGY